MITTTCTHKNCSRSFSKPNETRAKLALEMHIARVHTRRIVTPTGPRNHKSRDYAPLVAVKPAVNDNGKPHKHNGQSHTHTHKRMKIARRSFAGVTVTPPNSNEFKFNFCPGCGGNIQEVAQGVVIARALNNNPKLLQKVLAQIKA